MSILSFLLICEQFFIRISLYRSSSGQKQISKQITAVYRERNRQEAIVSIINLKATYWGVFVVYYWLLSGDGSVIEHGAARIDERPDCWLADRYPYPGIRTIHTLSRTHNFLYSNLPPVSRFLLSTDRATFE